MHDCILAKRWAPWPLTCTGHVSSAPVQTADVLETMLDLANIALPDWIRWGIQIMYKKEIVSVEKAFKLIYYRIWIRDVFWLGPLGPGTKGAWILRAQDKRPIVNQHPLSLALLRDRAQVLGVLIAKQISNPDVACEPC